jgi:hypothetical protein
LILIILSVTSAIFSCSSIFVHPNISLSPFAIRLVDSEKVHIQ